jgi:hypothetical protein
VNILRSLDGDVPAGSMWHQEILRAAGVAVEGMRPEILSSRAMRGMTELLRFRHFARHPYDAPLDPAPLDPARVDDVVAIALDLRDPLTSDVRPLVAHLRLA